MMIRFHSHRVLAPAGDADGGGGDAVDRGDDLTVDNKAAEDKAAEDKAAEDKAAEDKVAEEKAAADKAAADKGEDADKTDKTKDTRVPLARHKAMLEKEREARADLEKKLAKYEGGQTVAETNEQITKDENELLRLESEHAKLITDGEHEKAAKAMTAIRKIERGINETKSMMAIQAAESRAVERVRYDTTVDRLEAAYPMLNPDNEDYDEAKTREVLELKGAYQMTGYTPSEAIQKAAKTILGVATTKQDKAVTVTPKVDADAAAKELADKRKAEQVKKNIDAAGKQPPSTKHVGSDSDKAGGALTGDAVLRMKYDDFKKLDEDTLARLRGDLVS